MPRRIESGFLMKARSVSPTGQGNDPQKPPGVLSTGAVYLAGPPVSQATFSPNFRPFPLDEVGKSIRQRMFNVAAKCFLKAKGVKPQGKNDIEALKAASVIPETTKKARQEVINRDIEEMRQGSNKSIKEAKTPQERAALIKGLREAEKLIRTKLKQGRALVRSKPPRILISPMLFAQAKAGKIIPKRGSARMIYRYTFLEEQAHIYLHLRGVDISTEIKASLDELLAQPQSTSSGSCHHKAIPIAKKSYIAKNKKSLGSVAPHLNID